MVATFAIPRANAPLIVQGGLPSREWYSYWQNLQADSGGPSNAELAKDIAIISDKLGSPDGTPEGIPVGGGHGTIVGVQSVASAGALPGVVTLSLQGDQDAPGNTTYYGTDPTGAKGFFPIASAFLGTAGDITLTTDGTGVTTIDLATVTATSGGTLQKLAFDTKGRRTQAAAATTDDLTEGTTNLYFTKPRVAGSLIPGAGITITTDGAGNSTIAETGSILSNLTDQALVLMTDQSAIQLTDNSTVTAQPANTVYAGPPSGGVGTPSFRALVSADIPFPTDYISGLKMTWNSVNSVSVSTGEAVIPSTGLLETVNATLTLSGLSLSASTFYHIYLFDNAGTPTIECVTTAPDVPYRGTARAKTGDATRRYVGSVLTDGSGNLWFFQQILTRVSYGWGGAGAAPQRPLSGGTATTATSVSLTGGIPSTATFANVRATNGDAAQGLRLANSLVPGAVGSTGAGTNFLYAVSANSNGYFDIPVDGSRSVLYWYVAAPTGVCSIDLFGYIYER